MGLYDGNKINLNLPEFHFEFEWKKFKPALLLAAALLLVLFFAFSIALMLQPKALSAALSPNPLDSAKNGTSYLTVVVNNLSDATASDVVVSVQAEAPDSITIYPSEQKISTLGKGESRTLDPFAVSPNPNENVYSGTYILTIKTTINGKEYIEQVALELKAV